MYYNEDVLSMKQTPKALIGLRSGLALWLTSLRKHECAIYYAFKAGE